MAEEKHRMLFQGQNPCQTPTQEPQERRPATPACPNNNNANRDSINDFVSEPQLVAALPPTYDDAVANAVSYTNYNFNPIDMERRRTFYAEPKHYRSPLQQSNYILSPQPNPNSGEVIQLQPMTMLRPRQPMPQVRNFFTVAPQPKLKSRACAIVCPACGVHGITVLKRSANARTHSWAMWLCTIGWCCCACCCPYMIKSCRTTSHYCGACKTFLGAHYPSECFY